MGVWRANEPEGGRANELEGGMWCRERLLIGLRGVKSPRSLVSAVEDILVLRCEVVRPPLSKLLCLTMVVPTGLWWRGIQ